MGERCGMTIHTCSLWQALALVKRWRRVWHQNWWWNMFQCIVPIALALYHGYLCVIVLESLPRRSWWFLWLCKSGDMTLLCNYIISEERMSQNQKGLITFRFPVYNSVMELTHLMVLNKSCWDPVNLSPYCHFYWFPPPFTTESVYDLLPRELQLPSSTQQSPKVMSQKSGGEAGPLPSASLASGRILLLLSLFLLCKQDWSCPTLKKVQLML